MKANRRDSASVALLAAALLAGCAAERKVEPRPAPTQAARPVPAPVAVVATAPADWRDAPITPGEWTYASEPGGFAAKFGPAQGEPRFSLRCQRAAPRVVLGLSGATSGSVPMTVITTTATRAFTALAPPPGAPQQLNVSLDPREPLLDAMAFSRGRFAVEVPGLPTLHLPVGPEIGRVIEDCR